MANFLLKAERADDDTTVDSLDNKIADLETQLSIALIGDDSLLDVSTPGPYVATAGHDHDTVYEVLGKGVTGGDAHDHTGGAGAQIDHTGLLNIGTNTHAQIDTFIGTTADLTYAPIAKGVTDGDSHDHTEGAGAAITEGAITLADVTTLDVSGSMHGLAPKLPAADPTNKYLRGDGTWVTPPGLGESITEGDITLADVVTLDVSGSKHGFAPKLPAADPTTKFLRGDAAWAVVGDYDAIPTGTGPVKVTSGAFDAAAANIVESEITLADNTTLDVSGTKHGLVPKLPAVAPTTKFLRGDGAFDVATVVESGITLADNTTGDVSTSKHGLVPKAPNDVTKFLSGLGTWVVVDTEGVTPSGTGFRHVTIDTEDGAVKLVENDDVATDAAIAASKIDFGEGNSAHAVVTLGTDAGAVLGLTGQQIDLDTQVANRVFAGPATGADADPTFRALVAADVPAHASTHQHGGSDPVATATAAVNSIPKAGASGKLAIGWIPTGTAGTEVCIGNDARLPTSDQKGALAGQGAYPPSGTNKLVSNDYLASVLIPGYAAIVHASRHDGGADDLNGLLTPAAHQHITFDAGLVLHGTLNTTNGDIVAGNGNISGAAITASGVLSGASVAASGNISGAAITASGLFQAATVKSLGNFACNTKTPTTPPTIAAPPTSFVGVDMVDINNLVALKNVVVSIRTALINIGLVTA